MPFKSSMSVIRDIKSPPTSSFEVSCSINIREGLQTQLFSEGEICLFVGSQLVHHGVKSGFWVVDYCWPKILELLIQPVPRSSPPAGQPGIQEKSLRESRPTFKPPEEQIPDIQIEDSRTVKDAGEGPSFFVRKIVIEDNTLFDDEILGPIVDIGEGLELTLGILSLMAQEITAYYSQEGYILARAFIPEQEIKDGIVTIRVLEGRVGKVQVTGNQKFDTDDILYRMRSVQEEPIFQKATLEKTLLQLNEIVGFNSKTTLKPGQEFGTSDILVDVKESRPYRISLDGSRSWKSSSGQVRPTILPS